MDIDATVNQVARLKQALADYALSPGFAKRLAALRHARGLEGTSAGTLDEAVEMLLYEGLDGLEPLLQRYLRTNKNLDPADRAVYEGWRDRNVVGAFRIDGGRGTELLLHNLIDEMDYRTTATTGVIAGTPSPRGGYAFVRLVPTGGIWTISGNVRLVGPESRSVMEDVAVDLLQQFPRMPFRNPDKLARARTMIGEQHEVFMGTFGTHVVLGNGTEAINAYRTFMEALDAERAPQRPNSLRRPQSGAQLAPDGSFPAELRAAADVALFHHPVKSTSFLIGYRGVQEAHRVPPTAAQDAGALRLREYVHDDSIPAHVLEDLAAQFPDTVDEAYRVAFSIPGFHWKDDGAALLREHKPAHVEDADIPDITSVPTSLREAFLRQAAQG